jgi:hypothetical protein
MNQVYARAPRIAGDRSHQRVRWSGGATQENRLTNDRKSRHLAVPSASPRSRKMSPRSRGRSDSWRRNCPSGGGAFAADRRGGAPCGDTGRMNVLIATLEGARFASISLAPLADFPCQRAVFRFRVRWTARRKSETPNTLVIDQAANCSPHLQTFLRPNLSTQAKIPP